MCQCSTLVMVVGASLLMTASPSTVRGDDGRGVRAAPPAALVGAAGTQEGDSAKTPLPRYREGGTPYNPNQSLTPYPVKLRSPMDSPSSGLMSSPPEYGPARGVIFEYGGGWASVVTACVKALTADPTHDEIAYVVVSSQSVANTATSAFVAAGATMSKVVFLIQPNDSIWLRDYGPHFVWQNGTMGIVDSHYYPTRPLDNFIPTLLADDYFQVPSYDIGLYYSGGNFQPGPNRSGFVTSLVTADNPPSGGFSESLLREFYDTFQGIDTLHILPQLPTSVDGTGHIDMWMYLVDENTVILSEFIPGSNATAISITNNAVPYMQALGFEVIRPKAWNSGGTHYTYTNAFRVNDRIFVPVYGTSIVAGGSASYNDEDADAMAKWQLAAGPNVEIVPIQCYSIIPAAGAIHCIVMQVPRYTEAMPAAHVLEPSGGDVWLVGNTETIRWNATDTNNAALARVDLAYSLDDGTTWIPIATGIPDTGSYAWTVPPGASTHARIRVIAQSADGDLATAVSNAYHHAHGTRTVYDFASGAGVNKFGLGRQTTSWTGNVAGNSTPVTSALSAANYVAMSTSNATGGDTDTNRYISASVSTGSESTHTFRFTIAEDPAQIDELTVLWEGYADNCTQAELYVWNVASHEWGDAVGRLGQNRFLDSFAGNRDGRLVGTFRSNVGNFIDADGTILFLVYGQRSADETFHDYMSVTVKRVDECTGDVDGGGTIDGQDLALLLGAWGSCGGCAADLDGSGTVDGADLAMLLGGWGTCP